MDFDKLATWIIIGLTALLLASMWTHRPAHPAVDLQRPLARESSSLNVVATTMEGERHEFGVDAITAYGATPWEEVCPQDAVIEKYSWRSFICVEESAASAVLINGGLHIRLSESDGSEARERAIRDANAAILRLLRRPEQVRGEDWSGLFYFYRSLAEKTKDLRLLDMAAEIARINAAMCDRRQFPSCPADALIGVGNAFVDTGRETNDLERLVRASELLKQAVDTLPDDHDETERANLIEDLGAAYNYAAHFAPEGQKVRWLNLVIEAGESNMPYAEANAPSFISARIWSNLGGAYGARGGDQSSAADFRRAVELYERALGYFRRDEDPQAFAATTQNLAAARSVIASEERSLARHDQVMIEFETSIATFEDEGLAYDAAYARLRMAGVLAARAKTAIEIKSARRADDPPESRLDEIARNSLAEALRVLDVAEPLLREAESASYLRRLDAERAYILQLREKHFSPPN